MFYSSERGIRGGSFDNDDHSLHAGVYGGDYRVTGESRMTGLRVAKVSGAGPQDRDGDGDVDLVDFASNKSMDVWRYAQFQRAFTGQR